MTITQEPEYAASVRIENATITITDGKHEYVLESELVTLDGVYYANENYGSLMYPYRRLVVAMRANADRFTYRLLTDENEDDFEAQWYEEVARHDAQAAAVSRTYSGDWRTEWDCDAIIITKYRPTTEATFHMLHAQAHGQPRR